MSKRKDDGEKDKQGEIAPSSSLFSALVYLGISVLCALIVFGAFGRAGKAVTDKFFLGIFGFATYGYVVGLMLIGLLKLFKVRRKVSGGSIALYVITLLVIVLMCHLATSRQYASSWGEYIKGCYNGADTAGGALMSLLMYPLVANKVIYILSMVVLGLVVGGLVALIVVGMLNLDGIFAWRKRSKLGKIAGDETYYNHPRSNVPDIDKGENMITLERSRGLRSVGKGMYNGSKEGKTYKDEFKSSFFNRPLKVTPIEKLEEDERDIIEPDDSLYPDNADSVVGMYKKLDKSSENKYASGKDYARDILFNGEGGYRKQEDDRPALNRDSASQILYGDGFSDFVGRGRVSNDENLPDESIDLYFNGTRKQQIDENVKKLQAQEEDYTEEVTPAVREPIESESEPEVKPKSIEELGLPHVKDDSNMVLPEKFDSSELDAFIEDAKKSWIANLNKSEAEDKSERSSAIFDDFTSVTGGKDKEEVKPAVDNEDIAPSLPKPEVKPVQSIQPIKPVIPAPKPQPATPAPKAEAPKEEAEVEGKFNGMPVLTPHKYKKSYAPPKLELLNDYQESVKDNTDFNSMIASLEAMLEDFKVPAKVVNIVKGPRFSRLELQMPRSVSVTAIPRLEEDIKACLMVNSVRIEAPIRGKNLVGIEVPNKEKGAVGLKTIINSVEFARSNKDSGIYFAMGKDIDNVNYVCNIADFPHALVAGASGAGKSVFLNCLLCSMLYKYSPQEVRFLLIDPKVVEFKPYEGLPHLLLPYAISDEKMVLNALNWLVNEMEYRYTLFSKNRVSNLAEYNASGQERLPKLVLIVDEVGDIMTSSISKEFEVLIKRLAQKARAAGIHIILATQRPSVDVITGTIKANLPTRVAFAVTSYVDSKTILDTVGAEKLLRYGDLLYKEGSMPDLMRVQGALIVSKEIYAVCDYVKQHNEAYFDPAIESYITTIEDEKPAVSGSMGSGGEDGILMEDPYFKSALEYFIQTGNVSISKLQRRFGLGFPRAAKLVDRMEELGYIEHQIAGKNRGVLMTQEQFDEMYGGAGDDE